MLQVASDTTCLYLYDGIGNPVAMANNRSATNLQLSFDPYGAATRIDSAGATRASAFNPFTFEGGIQDRVSGQVKFGKRWYSADTGAWMQQDTLNAPLDPDNANRYQYAASDPINMRDPRGDDASTDIVLAGVGIAAAGAIGLAGFGGLLFLAGASTEAVETGFVASTIVGVGTAIVGAISSIF